MFLWTGNGVHDTCTLICYVGLSEISVSPWWHLLCCGWLSVVTESSDTDSKKRSVAGILQRPARWTINRFFWGLRAPTGQTAEPSRQDSGIFEINSATHGKKTTAVKHVGLLAINWKRLLFHIISNLLLICACVCKLLRHQYNLI